MAYSTQSQLNEFLGSTLATNLIDRDEDGSEDSGVYDALVARADKYIDDRLRQVYDVSQISDQPNTEGILPHISLYLTAAYFYDWWDPDSEYATHYRERAEQMLDRLVKGEMVLPDVPRVTGTSARRTVHKKGNDPVFAGADSDGKSRMAGW